MRKTSDANRFAGHERVSPCIKHYYSYSSVVGIWGKRETSGGTRTDSGSHDWTSSRINVILTMYSTTVVHTSIEGRAQTSDKRWLR
jgi:hypothetical protein